MKTKHPALKIVMNDKAHKTLVSLKEALQAKEKGFDGLVLWYYDKDGLKHITDFKSDSFHPEWGYNFNHRYSNELKNLHPVSAPTKKAHKDWLNNLKE